MPWRIAPCFINESRTEQSSLKWKYSSIDLAEILKSLKFEQKNSFCPRLKSRSSRRLLNLSKLIPCTRRLNCSTFRNFLHFLKESWIVQCLQRKRSRNCSSVLTSLIASVKSLGGLEDRFSCSSQQKRLQNFWRTTTPVKALIIVQLFRRRRFFVACF